MCEKIRTNKMLKTTFDLTKFLSFATFFVQGISKVVFVNELFVFMIKQTIGKFLSPFFSFFKAFVKNLLLNLKIFLKK